MSNPLVYVCTSKDCRKSQRAHAALLKALEGPARVREVGCQKICEGPVCGLEVEETLEWFSELDSDKLRGALLALVAGGELKKVLAKRRVKARSGKLRR